MIPRTLLFIALLLAAVLIYAATKPSTLRVYRSITVHAPADKIFPLINDFHNWDKWEAQDRPDPSVVKNFSGAASGSGAVYEWDSSGNAGKAKMVITESFPNQKVVVQVDFSRPFRAHNINQFDLEPDGNSSRVTWTWEGTNVYVLKLMSVFVNVDRMMGKHFEAGLQNLKSIAEK